MIKSNAPKDYICPICLGVKQIENDSTLIKPTDIVISDDLVTVLINSFFMSKNPGHAIIVPNEHYENIYDLDQKVGNRIFETAQRVSLAMKAAYHCDGITMCQYNEPAGDQHAFHYHLHVFPRYHDDGYGTPSSKKSLASLADRIKYAKKLERALKKLGAAQKKDTSLNFVLI